MISHENRKYESDEERERHLCTAEPGEMTGCLLLEGRDSLEIVSR